MRTASARRQFTNVSFGTSRMTDIQVIVDDIGDIFYLNFRDGPTSSEVLSLGLEWLRSLYSSFTLRIWIG